MLTKDIEMLKNALIKANLRDQEFVILAKRYGLDNQPRLSVPELAKMFHVSNEEIRKISRVAFFKLRCYISENQKNQFDNLIGEIFRPRRV